jgi:hypothetical protein
MKTLKTLAFLLLITLFISCSKQEVVSLDKPFVHIMIDDLNEIAVNSSRRDVVSYYIYLSSRPLNRNLEVNYSVVPGDGLQEGRDYEVITMENPLVFPPGIFQRPIQIRWLDSKVDPSKDNSLTIIVEGNNQEISTGLPGPDQNQTELKITKVNN